MKYPVCFVVRYICSTSYTVVWIQNFVQKHLCSQSSHYEKWKFPKAIGYLHATVWSTHFSVSKDKWDTKEDTGKSIKKYLLLQYAKMYFWGCSDVMQWKIKSVALTVIELHLPESISYSVENSVFVGSILIVLKASTKKPWRVVSGWYSSTHTLLYCNYHTV